MHDWVIQGQYIFWNAQSPLLWAPLTMQHFWLSETDFFENSGKGLVPFLASTATPPNLRS